jgi:[ribosomal protein S18]-alanine N-acetyltransferase
MGHAEAAIQVGDYRVAISRMNEHDLLEVVEIEQTCGLSPWGWDAYHAELGQGSAAIMLVAVSADRSLENGKRLAGFIVARLVADELHVNNVAVRPELRRHGIGVTLLQEALNQAAARDAVSAWLEVRAGNKAAQTLYERCGFQAAGLRRNYYHQPVEDALLMTMRLAADTRVEEAVGSNP